MVPGERRRYRSVAHRAGDGRCGSAKRGGFGGCSDLMASHGTMIPTGPAQKHPGNNMKQR